MEAWRRVERHMRVQDAFPRGGNALWSRADRVELFEALGCHERGWTAIGSRPSQVARPNTTGVHERDDAVSNIVGTDIALMVRIEHIPNSVAGGGIGAVAHLRAVHAERCVSISSRVINADPADPLVEDNAPTR
jgi:hypothetical protein